MPAEGSAVLEFASGSVPACDNVELASFFVCPVTEALMGVEVAATAPVARAKGVYAIWLAWYVVTEGLCLPSVIVQTASVVPESEQSPA